MCEKTYMTDRPGSVKMISAAPRAASVAPSTAVLVLAWGGRSVIGTVTSHGAQMAETLETLDTLVLVLGEDAGKTVPIEDHLIERQAFATESGTVLGNLGGVHVITETETTVPFAIAS